jgi:hypothetical protein
MKQSILEVSHPFVSISSAPLSILVLRLRGASIYGAGFKKRGFDIFWKNVK